MSPEQQRIERLKPGSTFALLGDGMQPCVMLSHHVRLYVDPRETVKFTEDELRRHLQQRFVAEMKRMVGL